MNAKMRMRIDPAPQDEIAIFIAALVTRRPQRKANG